MVYFFKVKSQTKEGQTWIVRMFEDGSLRCDCPVFIFTKSGICKHTRIVMMGEESQYENVTNEYLKNEPNRVQKG